MELITGAIKVRQLRHDLTCDATPSSRRACWTDAPSGLERVADAVAPLPVALANSKANRTDAQVKRMA